MAFGSTKGDGGGTKAISMKFSKRQTKNGMICNMCKEDKSLDEYGSHKCWCLPCVREYQRKRRAKLKKRASW